MLSLLTTLNIFACPHRKQTWRATMQHRSETQALTSNQKQNPHLVFYELFDYASLSQLREHLWFWLRLTITNGYTKKYYRYNDRDRIISLYEHLEKLLEASYLIYADKKEELQQLHRRLQEQELEEKDVPHAHMDSSLRPNEQTAAQLTHK